jgi:large subunit ribosomal protein L17
MRHRVDHRKLSRTASHRKALLRNLVTALFQHERIETTVAKAKEARRLAERLITYAKRNNLHSRRLVAAVVNDRAVVTKIFDVVAPLYATRAGGYTRILRTRRRLGDAGEMGILELVKSKEQKDAERRRHAEAKEAAKPEKKGLFGRRKKAEKSETAVETAVESTEVAAEKTAGAGTAKKATKKVAKKTAKKTGTAAPKSSSSGKAESGAKKERKPRAKTKPAEEKGAAKGKAKGGAATAAKKPPTKGGAAARKTRGSQKGK